MTGIDTQRFRSVMAWLALAVLAAGVIQIVRPFAVSLGWAAVLAVFFHPLYRRLVRLVSSRNFAALVTVALVTLLLIVPIALLVPKLVSQSVAFLGSASQGDYLDRARAVLENVWVKSPVPLGDLQEVFDDLARRLRGAVAQQSAHLAGNLLASLFHLGVTLFAMFYLLRDGERIVLLLGDVAPWSLERHDRMIRETAELVQVTMTSTFVTAAVQGALGGLVFWGLGLSSPLVWGALMALMAFLPVVGPWLVWGPTAIGLFVTGETTRGLALVVLGLVIISGVDNVLRPALIAGRSQLNGLLVFISVLGGIQAMGFLGVVAGPFVAATAVGLLRGYHETVEANRRVEQTSGGAGGGWRQEGVNE